MLNENFSKVFPKKAIIGMIHLAGENPVKQALEEISLFEETGVTAAIVENYHGTVDDVKETLERIAKRGTSLVIGINILDGTWVEDGFEEAFILAKEYNAGFIQVDRIAGRYLSDRGLNLSRYNACKKAFPEIVILGGVWPKYYHPIDASEQPLEAAIKEGMQRAEAVVVTGEGTGKRTPVEKIAKFRGIIGLSHPLVVGAGSTPESVQEELRYAQGVIVGTYFKSDNPHDEKTRNPLDRTKIREYIAAAREVR